MTALPRGSVQRNGGYRVSAFVKALFDVINPLRHSRRNDLSGRYFLGYYRNGPIRLGLKRAPDAPGRGGRQEEGQKEADFRAAGGRDQGYQLVFRR